MSKYIPFEMLSETCQNWQSDNERIVLAYGIFDFLHIGHIRFLEQAKALGTKLVVILGNDQQDSKLSFKADVRANAIANLNGVDAVAINPEATIDKALDACKPHLYVKGSEYSSLHDSVKTAAYELEKKACKERGIKTIVLDKTEVNPTDAINSFFASFSSELHQFIDILSQHHSMHDIIKRIDSLEKLNVLVIGDAILDEYRYCHHLGTSSKDGILTVQHENSDVFAGGILAIANHVASFAGHVDLITCIGDNKEEEAFIREKLSPKISPEFIMQSASRTLRKIKYIESYSLTKLFGIYVMDEPSLSQENEQKMAAWLEERISQYDLVLVADFGHGTISPAIRDLLAEKSPFLAVNTQANAGNKRIHTISRYSRADYVSISESELRLDVRDFDTDVRPLTVEAARRLNSKQFVVTRGRNGYSIAKAHGSYFVVPAFNTNVVDRIGSGDAFFAVTAMLATQDTDDEILGLVGNAVGALAVEILGNKEPITKAALTDYLMKLSQK
ncbi:MAG: PfkB family carbohydrate kinase [bacterium]|nr:PfkB family carbohydrate kinase [bacterium]